MKTILIRNRYENFIFTKKVDMESIGFFDGFEFFVIKNSSTYVNSGKLKIEVKDSFNNSFFVMIDDFYCLIDSRYSLELDKIDKENFKNFIDTSKKYFYNFNEENLRLLEDLKKDKEKWAQGDKEREEKIRLFEEEKKKELERYLKEKEVLLSGGFSTWGSFEKLCKELGILIPIRTLGSARKKITSISISHGYYLNSKKRIHLGGLSPVFSELKKNMKAS